MCRVKDPPDFCRKYELVTRFLSQKVADAMFTLATAVEGRGIVEAHAHIPGGLQDPLCLILIEHFEQVAQRRSAQPKLGNICPRSAYLPLQNVVHRSPSW